jgi:hypothetical protein
VVADLHARHARTDLLDDPRALVAEDHRQPGLEVAVRDVDIGVAQTRIRVADQDLTLLGSVEVELLDLDGLSELVHDGGLGLHRRPFRGGGCSRRRERSSR